MERMFICVMVGLFVVFSTACVGHPQNGAETTGVVYRTSIPSRTLEGSLFATGEDEDHDRDGLADEQENLVATVFRPYLIYDSAEGARSPGEPVTVFLVRPYDLCAAGKMEIQIKWLLLYGFDGGYGPSSNCLDDSHAGDNENMTYTLESDTNGKTWTITRIRLGGGEIAWRPPGEIGVYQSHHPVIFLSAHHHHQYLDTSYDHRDSRNSSWNCNDDVNGRGAAFLVNLGLLNCLNNQCGRIANAGEPAHHNPPFVNSLHGYYPGHSVWGDRKFYSVEPNKNKMVRYAIISQAQCECQSGQSKMEFCTVGGRRGERVR